MEYITEKAIEWSIPMPDNAEDILRDIQEQSDRRNAPLRFVTRYLLSESGFADSLNANAATRICRYIAVSSTWGAFIVLKNNEMNEKRELSSLFFRSGTPGHDITEACVSAVIHVTALFL